MRDDLKFDLRVIWLITKGEWLYIGFYVENVKFPHSLLQIKFGYDIINVSVYHNIVLNLKKGMIDL